MVQSEAEVYTVHAIWAEEGNEAIITNRPHSEWRWFFEFKYGMVRCEQKVTD